MKVSELAGAKLDFWVAKACGYDAEIRVDDKGEFCRRFERMKSGSHCIGPFFPSSQWVDGGPIIEREDMNIGPSVHVPLYFASAYDGSNEMEGRTMLEAAMRCYVASKYGEEVANQ